MSKSLFFNMKIMPFNTIGDNKILAKISEFTVTHFDKLRHSHTIPAKIKYNAVLKCSLWRERH